MCALARWPEQALVKARRPKGVGGGGGYRERAQLLLLYEDLVGCCDSPEPRVRAQLRGLLLAVRSCYPTPDLLLPSPLKSMLSPSQVKDAAPGSFRCMTSSIMAS